MKNKIITSIFIIILIGISILLYITKSKDNNEDNNYQELESDPYQDYLDELFKFINEENTDGIKVLEDGWV